MDQETRPVSGFQRVLLRGYGEMTIAQGESESLTVEANPELLGKIITEVKDGRLDIRLDEDWFDWIGSFFNRGFENQRIKYQIIVKTLSGLDIHGAARVQVDDLQSATLAITQSGAADMRIGNLECNHLSVSFPGTGSLKITGSAKHQEVNLSGAGSYRAGNLRSENADVKLSGVGKATVWATENLNIKLHGLGSVNYYGNPRVQQSVTGLGSVQGLGEKSSESQNE